MCLGYLRAGDTLVVWRLDRLGRSLRHLVETVNVLAERGVAFAAILYPPGELAIRYPEGRRIALWEGVGRAVLAALSERDIAEIVDLKTRPELRQAIEETRRVGVAVSHGEVIAGITALGAAVLDAAGSPIAVVVVVAPRDAEPEQHATALRDAAAELTALLSYQPTPRPGTPAPN